MHRRLRVSKRWMLLASALSAAPFTALAQTWISATDGSWSDVSRWSALPSAGTSTNLFFVPTGAQTYTATDDFGAPFTLGTLTFGGTSTGAVTLGSGPTSSLRFAAGTTGINNSGLSPVLLAGRMGLLGIVNVNLTSPNNNVTIFNNVLTGAGGLTVTSTGTGSVQLNTANSFNSPVTLS